MARTKAKLRKGQPIGARSASGRKRDRTPLRVAPCDGILRRRAAYGAAANDMETHDALGRAWQAGLLHPDPDRARALLDAGRRIGALYWSIYGFRTRDSLARFMPQQSFGPRDPEKERAREDALNDALARVGARGRPVRAAFDALAIDLNPDGGPAFLDRIIFAHRRQGEASAADYAVMALAREGLEAVV